MWYLSTLDGDPDGLTLVLGLDDLLLQAVKPDAAVEHLTYQAIFAYEDAAFGVFRAVACVDADALPLLVELWATEQDGKPLLKFWREGDNYCVAAFWDGRAAFHLVGTVGIVAPSGFEGVAEILVLRSCQILVVYTSLDVDGALLERLMNLIRIFI